MGKQKKVSLIIKLIENKRISIKENYWFTWNVKKNGKMQKEKIEYAMLQEKRRQGNRGASSKIKEKNERQRVIQRSYWAVKSSDFPNWMWWDIKW